MNEENRNEELILLDLFNVLRRYKRLLLGLPLVGAILATLLVTLVLRPTWEASAVLEVGHAGDQVPVEAISNVITRMTLPSFAKGALSNSGINSDDLNEMGSFFKTLKVDQVKGAELIELKIRGPSPEKAKILMSGAIASLQKAHAEKLAVTVDKNKKQLQFLVNEIQKSTADAELIKQKLLASHNWNAFDATLSATVLKDKSDQLRDMTQKKLLLEEQLSLSRSYNTKVLDDIYVSEDPVSPKKLLIIGLATLLGLFGSVVIAFVHNALNSKPA